MKLTITTPFRTATPDSAMKPRCGDREWNVAEVERRDPACQRERDAAEDHERMANGFE
jgi:hypothetical protein